MGLQFFRIGRRYWLKRFKNPPKKFPFFAVYKEVDGGDAIEIIQDLEDLDKFISLFQKPAAYKFKYWQRLYTE